MAQRVALMSYPVSQSLPQRNCINLKFSKTSLRVSKHSWLWLEISGHSRMSFPFLTKGNLHGLCMLLLVLSEKHQWYKKIIFQKPIIYKTQLNFTWKDTPNLHRSNPTLTFFFSSQKTLQLLTSVSAGFEPLRSLVAPCLHPGSSVVAPPAWWPAWTSTVESFATLADGFFVWGNGLIFIHGL